MAANVLERFKIQNILDVEKNKWIDCVYA